MNKKPFWKSFYFSMSMLVTVYVSVMLFVIFDKSDRKKPNAVRLDTKNARCVYIGNVSGTSMDAYKLTVDSIDYILVRSYQGLTITKAN